VFLSVNKFLVLAALLVAATQSAAETQPHRYFGLFGGDARIRPGEGGRGTTNNLNFKLGYEYGRFWGAEVHLGKDYSRDQSVGADGVQYGAAMLRGNLPFDRVNVYGLLGLASVSADVANIDGSYTNGAAGVGIELYGSRNTAVAFEFVQYGFDDRYSTASLGVIHHFDWPHFR